MSQTQTTLAWRALCFAFGAFACNAILGIDEASLSCPAGSDCSEPVAAAQAVATELPAGDAGGVPVLSEGALGDGAGPDAGSESPPGLAPIVAAPADPADPALPECTECAACTPAGFLCRGSQLLACDPRLGPQPVADCGSSERCDAQTGACLPALCTAGDVSCDGARLIVCKDDGSGFTLLDDCESAARCDAEAAACAPAACEPEERRCQAATLQVCNDDRTGFVAEQQCSSAALCRTDGCAPALCGPDQRRCQGAQLESCNADQTGFSPEQQCASAALCSPAGCQPAACAANQRRCQGAQLELCNAQRTGFEPEQQCASAVLCSPAGCQPPSAPPAQPPPAQPPSAPPAQPPPAPPPPPPPTQICVPGARRCLNATTVAVCAASGLAETSSPCALLQSCSNGSCTLLGLPL